MIVKEITRETLPPERYSSHCTEFSCASPTVTAETIGYLEGWWRSHVQKTGHRVVIEERE